MTQARLRIPGIPLSLGCGLALLFITACATKTTSGVNWEALESAGRVVERPAGMDVLFRKGSYHWGDGHVALELVPVAGGFARGSRIATYVEGAAGNRTRFTLDTGSVGSLLSSKAPLAREVMLSRIPVQTRGTSARGYIGHLPSVRMGSLKARDLAVALVTQSQLPDIERNILGIVHLFHTQIEHRAGVWTLRSGSARRPPSEAGWVNVRLLPGTPVLELRGPHGETVKALMDSGAYQSLAVGSGSKGTYVIPALDGSVAHRFVVSKKENRQVDAASYGGHEISVLLGNDVLSSRDWRLTFDESVWSFVPVR